jgi:hypothetical protein
LQTSQAHTGWQRTIRPLAGLDTFMNSVGRNVRILAIFGFVLGMLVLSACSAMNATPSGEQLLVQQTAGASCETCAQATSAAALTQDRDNVDNQAEAAAEIARANAQSTLDAANGTLSAAQTQDQNNADVIAAQIAGTAEIVRANAQATINSAGATQNAAFTQDAILQTQMADLSTTSAQSVLNQQNSDKLAAGTQTALADTIATQTQIAEATSQWYLDQSRQREEQRQGPIAFLWRWCLPMFIVLLGGLALWGFWRWLTIQQSNQLMLGQPVERLPATVIEALPHEHEDLQSNIESDIVDDSSPATQSDDQVRGWLDEVKRSLRGSDRKDENDNANEQ